jgi:glycerol-3-phosphate acyltransferase PlsY
MFVPLLIAVLLGYLLGSLPFGYLVARAKGVNIFEVGSRNPGATNVRRVLGKGPGNLVLALDALKGAVAASWALLRLRTTASASGTFDEAQAFLNFHVTGEGWVSMGIAGLVGALLGHSFSCFTKFKGGKGVATGAGGFTLVFPQGALIALLVWAAIAATTRYVSVASMVAALSLPVSAWFLRPSPVLITASAAVALFVILRHRANIGRLLAGTENKIGQAASTKT